MGVEVEVEVGVEAYCSASDHHQSEITGSESRAGILTE